MSFYMPETVTCNGDRFKLLISKERIEKRLKELGEEIDAEYAGKKPILIGVLNGRLGHLNGCFKILFIHYIAQFINVIMRY